MTEKIDWNKIRENRMNGLIYIVDWYNFFTIDHPNHKLSPDQKKQLEETRDTLSCFGEEVEQEVELCNDILRENG